MKMNLCQSCAMPLKKPEDFGTNQDGSENQEYCRYCFQNGAFTDPDMTMDEMLAKVTDIMQQMNIPKMFIEKVKTIIPTLKRWQK